MLADGANVEWTRQPGGDETCVPIRNLILSGDENGNAVYSPKAQLFLFLADRAQHVDKHLGSVFHEKKMIICDRYFVSTLVFQHERCGMSWKELIPLNMMAMRLDSTNPDSVEIVLPELTLLLDLEPEHAAYRLNDRGGKNHFDSESIAGMEERRQRYLDVLAHLRATGMKSAVVDAGKPFQDVVKVCVDLIKKNLGVLK